MSNPPENIEMPIFTSTIFLILEMGQGRGKRTVFLRASYVGRQNLSDICTVL
jgi:hypothetical protein